MSSWSLISAANPSDPVGFAEALVGLPVATVVVVVVLMLGVALHRRIIVLGRELSQAETSHAATTEAIMASHERELQALASSIDTMKEERDWWRDTAIRALDLGERAVATSRSHR